MQHDWPRFCMSCKAPDPRDSHRAMGRPGPNLGRNLIHRKKAAPLTAFPHSEVPPQTGQPRTCQWAVRLCRLSIARGQAQRRCDKARSRGPASAGGGPMLAEAPRGKPPPAWGASCGPVSSQIKRPGRNKKKTKARLRHTGPALPSWARNAASPGADAASRPGTWQRRRGPLGLPRG
jgi:hypothetical protein